MFDFELTDKFLTDEEQNLFNDYLNANGLDKSIWRVFACLFNANSIGTKPMLLKVYKDSNLYGAVILIKCAKYGKSLFKNELLYGIINYLNIPFYLWIKFGCCMDMMSNPGFVRDPDKTEEVFKVMIKHLKENYILTIINDYTENYELYESASILPALPHALIDSSSMTSIEDYTKCHKNIKRKIRVFEKKGGIYKRVDRFLSHEQVSSLKRCFLSTAEKSIFYLPYQDLYLNAALYTSKTRIDNVYYFVATINGEFIGYQAAIKTGSNLNALHGAFDRNLKTTSHAYDILFVNMTKFAIENNLRIIDFGAVLNFTKQKMINKSIDMSYFILSKYSVIQKVFNYFLKMTKVQSRNQLEFRVKNTTIPPSKFTKK